MYFTSIGVEAEVGLVEFAADDAGIGDRRVGSLVALLLEIGGEFGDRFVGAVARHDQNERQLGERGHVLEVVDRIKGQFLEQAWRGRKERTAGRDEQRVAVWLGLADIFGCDIAECADLVLSDDRFPELVLELLAVEAHEYVGAGAGRKSADRMDLPGGPRVLGDGRLPIRHGGRGLADRLQ